MDDAVVIALYSCFMFVGSCAAGCIPLVIRPTGSNSRLVNIFGAGVLFGAALALIIPEGMESMNGRAECARPSNTLFSPNKTNATRQDSPPMTQASYSCNTGCAPSTRGLAGLVLVAGFTLMLIIDQLFGGHEHSQDDDPAIFVKSAGPPRGPRGFAATVGLVLHGLADGVALGAAATTADAELSTVVFAAIMLHKAPASFGLTTFLLHNGLGRVSAFKRLLAFSASAPTAALVTFFSFTAEGKEVLQTTNAAGFALLFSGGTFLYVAAVSVLPEVSSKTARTVTPEGTVVISQSRSFTKCETLAISLGAAIPVLIAFGHDD